MTVDGGCSYRSQLSRGVWGHAPPPPGILHTHTHTDIPMYHNAMVNQTS